MTPTALLSSLPQVRVRRITAAQTVPLRHAVLWPDKPVSYVLLPEDAKGHHFGAFGETDEEEPLAVISLFAEEIPSSREGEGTGAASPGNAPDLRPPAARFRKFACHPSYQGRGIGSALLRRVVEVARTELGCTVLWCDARVDSAGWYERRGLKRFGETFYKGEVEYVRMQIPV